MKKFILFFTGLIFSLSFYTNNVFAQDINIERVAVAYPNGEPDYILIVDDKPYFVYEQMVLVLEGINLDFTDLSTLGNYNSIIVLNLPIGSIITASNWLNEDIENPSYIYYHSQNNMIYIYNIDDELIESFTGPYIYDLVVMIPINDEESYNQGYNYGYNMGHQDGYSLGYDDGYDAGYDMGEADGYDRGYDEGVRVTEPQAYQAGYNKGAQEAFIANMHIWIVPAIILVIATGIFVGYRRKDE